MALIKVSMLLVEFTYVGIIQCCLIIWVLYFD